MLEKTGNILTGNKSYMKRGQVLLEFTFCMIIVMLMIFGVTKVFLWTGKDFAERAIAHDGKLVIGITEAYHEGDTALGPLKQLDSYFYKPVKMNAIYKGNP